MGVPETILALLGRFAEHRDEYRSGKYNETQLRRDFLDPFFAALGWDVHNAAGYAETYREVIHEDAVKVGGLTKAPDYSFRVGGVRKFFVEAKKPSVSIKDDPAPAYQVRRYAWSAKLALSIVTDFEELAVYDCRIKPDPADQPSAARVLYLTFEEFAARWEEIAGIFSKEAVLKGSFDKYADSRKAKRGTAAVDEAFLAEIERWRDLLARNIALRNPALSTRELNEVVTRTVDRVIFLRICEDRRIEDYGALLALQNGEHVYGRLKELYRKADARYNSGLFYFRHEKDRPGEPDALTLNLAIDDKVLKEIIKGLYYPESPYEFSVLPAEILGQVYEQFLGKVIRLTEGHRAVVEEKPEVKKAGGVYYTPTYIVDYIVKNTVGPLLEGKTPKQAEKLRVLDPACGSGSFLLGAYQHLLDWHLDWYTKHAPEKWAQGKRPVIYEASLAPPAGRGQGEGTPAWRLTSAERKRILLNNIYGVDIDSQAVEVTKLSLLLKVLEGETGETLNRQLTFLHERALPDLAANIKCGNSLIGPDYLSPSPRVRGEGRGEGMRQTSFLPELSAEDLARVNPFDWPREFPEVFAGAPSPAPSPPMGARGTRKNPSSRAGEGASSIPSPRVRGEGQGEGIGGFDAVIGNPPYIRIQTLKEWAPLEVELYKQFYRSAAAGNYDIYVVFVERGIQLLNTKGRLGFILPHKFFNAKYGEALRGLISEGKHLAEVVHFGDQQVFKGATTYTCLMFLDKAERSSLDFAKVHDLDGWRISQGPALVPVAIASEALRPPEIVASPAAPRNDAGAKSSPAPVTNQAAETGKLHAKSITSTEWNFSVGAGGSLFKKLSALPVSLGDLADRLAQGIRTSANEVYVLSQTSASANVISAHSDQLDKSVRLEKGILSAFLLGREIKRYMVLPAQKVVLVPYRLTGTRAILIPENDLHRLYPEAYAYLKENKEHLESREKGRMKGEGWYGYVYPKNIDVMRSAKILVPDIADRASFAYDESGEYSFTSGYGITLKQETQESPKYILGLLNSNILDFFLKRISTTMRGGFFRYFTQFIEQLPIRPINFSDPADKRRHDEVVTLVERMLALHKQLAAARTEHEKTLLQRRIDATDREIDRLVYDLYGLTEEEIKIVEGSSVESRR